MKILKFGGSSIKNAAEMKSVANILESYPSPILIVLSATYGTTDDLLQIVNLASEGNMEKASALKQNLEKNI